VSSTGTALVTLEDGEEMARFSISAPTVPLTPVQIGLRARTVQFNAAGTLAYVASDNKVSVVDVATGTVKSATTLTADVGHVVLSPDETRLFANGGNGSVWTLSAASPGAPTATATLTRSMSGLAISKSGTSLYAAGSLFELWRLDPTTLQIAANVKTLGTEVGDVVVSQDEKEVYVVADQGTLWVLDATTLAPAGYVDVGHGALWMALTPDGKQLYVSSWSMGDVIIVDRVGRSVVSRVHVGGYPRSIAFDKLGTTAYVANMNGWVDVIK